MQNSFVGGRKYSNKLFFLFDRDLIEQNLVIPISVQAHLRFYFCYVPPIGN